MVNVTGENIDAWNDWLVDVSRTGAVKTIKTQEEWIADHKKGIR
jgi:hypothetical protein